MDKEKATPKIILFRVALNMSASNAFTPYIGAFSEKIIAFSKKISAPKGILFGRKSSLGVCAMTFSVSDGHENIKDQLRELAQDVVSAIASQDAESSQELLGMFVSELFLSATQQSIRKERSKRQRKAVAEAMARGVQFGAKRRPLPDNFDEVRRLWRSHEMNLKEAAKLCNMPATTFYDAVRRAEQEETEEQAAS